MDDMDSTSCRSSSGCTAGLGRVDGPVLLGRSAAKTKDRSFSGPLVLPQERSRYGLAVVPAPGPRAAVAVAFVVARPCGRSRHGLVVRLGSLGLLRGLHLG